MRPAVEPARVSVRGLDVDAVVELADDVDLADAGVRVDLDRDALGHRDHQLAGADAGLEGRGAGGSCDRAEVEVERTDPELIARLQRLGGQRPLDLVAGAR